MNKLFFTIIALLAVACNNSGNQSPADRANGYDAKPVTREDSLFHDVMNGHDTGMAKMGRLIGYEKRTRQAIDSIKALPAKQRNGAYLGSLDSLSKMLFEAETGMNGWMEEFKMDSATGSPDQRIRYLQGEKERVTKVNGRIREALQKADSVFH